MRFIAIFFIVSFSLILTSCMPKGSNPDDPYESLNRKTHKFNMAFDATVIKPPAKLYKAIVPPKLKTGIDNVYNNVNMLPTIANDLLQADFNDAIKDTWRFLINSTFGIAGIFDIAASDFSLPPHSNDLGITLAKWGDKQSPYFVIPFLGPSTFRDGMGVIFDYALFTPYPYISSDQILYSIIGLRYIDLRSQMFETDRLMGEAIDHYAFMRDAYLQHRHYVITGGEDDSLGTLYVDDDEEDDEDEDEDEESDTDAQEDEKQPFALTAG